MVLGHNHKKTEPVILCLRPLRDLVEVRVEVPKAVHDCLDLCQTGAIYHNSSSWQHPDKLVPVCSIGPPDA